MNNSQSQTFKILIPFVVILDFIIMRDSINFNNDIAVYTEKIHNIITNDFLSVKIVLFKFLLV